MPPRNGSMLRTGSLCLESSSACDRLRESATPRELYPQVSLLAPLGGNVIVAQARLDRRVARLQTIEAVRMHAAATGKLPETLAAVSVVPVPADPVTGQPFLYRLEGDVAVVDAVDGTPKSLAEIGLPVRIRAARKVSDRREF